MGAPIGFRIKQIQHWLTPPLCEYRTIDSELEPVADGEVLALPYYLSQTGQQHLDAVQADAIAKGLLPGAPE